jgi:thiamine biosynthesis protein ThiS
MTLTVNGETRHAPDGLPLQVLLDERHLSAGRVVVELNGAIIRSEAFPTIRLAAGDVLEIVQFVGGG